MVLAAAMMGRGYEDNGTSSHASASIMSHREQQTRVSCATAVALVRVKASVKYCRLGHAGHTAPTRQHNLDHANNLDQGSICLETHR